MLRYATLRYDIPKAQLTKKWGWRREMPMQGAVKCQQAEKSAAM
jgi:hypothetical protein